MLGTGIYIHKYGCIKPRQMYGDGSSCWLVLAAPRVARFNAYVYSQSRFRHHGPVLASPEYNKGAIVLQGYQQREQL